MACSDLAMEPLPALPTPLRMTIRDFADICRCLRAIERLSKAVEFTASVMAHEISVSGLRFLFYRPPHFAQDD